MNKNLELFLTFMKIGAFTFGGGYAMIPLIQREVCDSKHWLNEDDILEVVAIAESTPGPVAINAATFVVPYYLAYFFYPESLSGVKSRAVCLYGYPCRCSCPDTQSGIYHVHGD